MTTPYRRYSIRSYSIVFFLLLGVLSLTACGSGRANEELLPTTVPTLGIEQVAALPITEPAATATSLPTAMPTALPVETPSAVISETTTTASDAAQAESPLNAPTVSAIKVPTVELPATLELNSALEVTGTLESKETLEPTVQPEMTATLALTPTSAIAVSTTLTPTAEATATPTISATATLVATATVSIDAVQPITQAVTLTTTQPVSNTHSNDAVESAIPVAVSEKLVLADKANGQLLTQKNACIGCHSLSEGVKLVGPSWYGLEDRAAERVAGQSAEDYLYTSIVKPNQFVVEGYSPGLMLQTYGETLSDQDMADIISYLLTLKAN